MIHRQLAVPTVEPPTMRTSSGASAKLSATAPAPAPASTRVKHHGRTTPRAIAASSESILDQWEPSDFLKRYIIPKSSVFNRTIRSDATTTAIQELHRHAALVNQVRPRAPIVVLTAIEQEAKKILRGQADEIAVTAGSFADAVLKKVKKEKTDHRRFGTSDAVVLSAQKQAMQKQQEAGSSLEDPMDQGKFRTRRQRRFTDGASVQPTVVVNEDGTTTVVTTQSPSTKNFRKMAKLIGKTMTSNTFKQERPTMLVRLRKAAKAVCKAVRNSKVDGRIGLRDFLLTHNGVATSGGDGSGNSHLLSLDAMEIWYKKPADRTSADLDYLERGISLLKCFSKYSPSVRRELCRAARLEMFQQGRLVLKQGHDPVSMYFIASGAIEIVKTDVDPETKKSFTQTMAVLNAGDSFGDIALLSKSKRSASAVCRSDCKLLRVDDDEYQEVLEMAKEQEKLGKWEFLKGLDVFGDMVQMPELRRLAEAAQLKEFSPSAVVIEDLDASDEIYFIRKGNCRVVEPIEFIQETFPATGRFNLRPFIPGRPLNPRESIITKLLDVEALSRQMFFGAGTLAASPTKRHALTAVFAKPKGKRGIAVIATTKMECLLIKKVDFLRCATDWCFDRMRLEVLQKSVEGKEVVAAYLASRAWKHHTRTVVREIYETKRAVKEQQRWENITNLEQ